MEYLINEERKGFHSAYDKQQVFSGDKCKVLANFFQQINQYINPSIHSATQIDVQYLPVIHMVFDHPKIQLHKCAQNQESWGRTQALAPPAGS